MITELESLLGKKAKISYRPFHKADILETQADITKAESLLNWHPREDLSRGLAETVNWYLNNSELVKAITLN